MVNSLLDNGSSALSDIVRSWAFEDWDALIMGGCPVSDGKC